MTLQSYRLHFQAALAKVVIAVDHGQGGLY
jgi:hypothetical protein